MKVFSRFSLRSFTLSTAAFALLAAAVPSADAAPQERSGALRRTADAAPKAAGPRLAGHVPYAAVLRSHFVGRVDSAEPVHLALTLPLRDQTGLSMLLARLYTPGDPLYGKFLTPTEFTERFGPTEADYAAVEAAARQLGFQVMGTHPNRLILDVSGPAATVESAFRLHLQRYRNTEGRVFRAPDAGPVLPAGLAGRLSGMVGLDDAVRLRPHLHPALSARGGSGPQGGLTPSDIQTAYSLTNSGAAGAGQAIALFELDGYTPSDITAYEAAYGLPAVPLQNILVGPTDGSTGRGANEVTLDIELAQALAPSLSKILVYETPNTDADALDAYNRIATDDLAHQVSTSWGEPENATTSVLTDSENSTFQQMAAQGQSILAVTGDDGAYDDGATLSVDDPGAQPYVTGVGGTTLATNGTGGPYASEETWGAAYNINDPNSTGGGAYGVGGGGGFSILWPTPSYQSALQPAPAMRSVPDVALDSDPVTGYSIYFGGGWTVYGGTSAAAPLWAGFTALVNQQRAAAGRSPIGFLNPPIYQIGASAAYSADFHDITTGDNLYYPAVPGYDNATGWGSFIGNALLSTLVSGLPAAQTGTLTGTITAADTGAALPGVTVTVLSAAGNAATLSTTTDATGAYTAAVPAGLALQVTVSAYTATGGRYAGAKVSAAALSAGQSAVVSAALQPAHTYPAGLQMISSPYDYTGIGDFAALFGLAFTPSGSTSRLIAWSPGLNSYVFYPTVPANTLTPGSGYWVNFPASSYLHDDGALVPTTQPFALTLSAGWNLIGDPFPTALPLPSITANGTALAASGLIAPTLYTYSTVSGQYVTVSAATDSLQPYVGYWIYTAQPVTLHMPAP